MMDAVATPEQVEAIQRGESVKLLVRMETQPIDYDFKEYQKPVTMRDLGGRLPDGSWDQYWCWTYDSWENKSCEAGVVCPVLVGDPVVTLCHGCEHDSGEEQCFEPCINYPGWVGSIVRSISHTETDGVHYWVIGVKS